LASFIAAKAAFATDSSFILKEYDGPFIVQEGVGNARHTPFCSFNFAISLMGFEEKILEDESHPVWPFDSRQLETREECRKEQTPTSWIKISCVWYSQKIMEQVGNDKFAKYIQAFDYGNQDISGDKGKANGLSGAWIGSSLKISPVEQVLFLEKLIGSKLPVSLEAYKSICNIFYVDDLPNGWRLYGKTGSGNKRNADGQQLECQEGWFAGWVSKEDKALIFAQYIEDLQAEEIPAGRRAKEQAIERLKSHLATFE
jgi:beta-lactamase class D